ncbi:MAG: sugar phosphate isomerase/epimerase family protein [Janthinobacterium lividum]
MAIVDPMEIGLMFWAEDMATATLDKVRGYGLRNGQLGLGPNIDLAKALPDWQAVQPSSGIVLTAAVCSYEGEDYSNLQRVHESVGFTTPKYRAERIARTKAIAAFANELGLKAVSCHIGFIPADPAEHLYAELIEVTRDICDDLAARGQNFVLETGQESAAVLLGFFSDVDRTNLKVNFDPANIVLYGSGDPVEALVLLRPYILSVHCKDGTLPASEGSLGHECGLGDGEVDFPSFLAQLKSMGYTGPLTIEREEPDEAQKSADVRTAIERLKVWKAEAGIA